MSSQKSGSYVWVHDLSVDQTQLLLDQAQEMKSCFSKTGSLESFLVRKNLLSVKDRQVVLLFNEPSTRTRTSFQMAIHRLGSQCLVIDSSQSTSLAKGESLWDTFLALHSLRPDLFVVRCGDSEPLEEWVSQSQVPIINGGYGIQAHPTQALLDLFTLREHFRDLEGLKVLFVGDVDHSRVFRSHLRLFKKWRIQMSVCSPPQLSQRQPKEIHRWDHLSQGVEWCDVYMGLRVQWERHGPSLPLSKEDYVKNYSLSGDLLGKLKPQGVVMHPGPIQWGLEFGQEVQKDSRLLVWKQVNNGFYIRAALVARSLALV